MGFVLVFLFLLFLAIRTAFPRLSRCLFCHVVVSHIVDISLDDDDDDDVQGIEERGD